MCRRPRGALLCFRCLAYVTMTSMLDVIVRVRFKPVQAHASTPTSTTADYSKTSSTVAVCHNRGRPTTLTHAPGCIGTLPPLIFPPVPSSSPPLPTALLALPFGIACTAALVLLTDRGVYRFYRVQKAAPIIFVMASVGVMFVTNGLTRLLIGVDEQRFDDESQRERSECQEVPADPEQRKADDPGDHHREDDCEDPCQPEGDAQLHLHDRRRVGAHGVERGLTQRNLSREAEDEREAERERAQHGDVELGTPAGCG